MPYVREPKTLGGHLNKRRHELGLFQKEVAERLDVDEWTVGNWEKGKTTPAVRYLPRIIDFLGYDPNPPARTLGERIATKWRTMGLLRKRLAKRLTMDEATLARWERGKAMPKAEHMERVKRLLDAGS